MIRDLLTAASQRASNKTKKALELAAAAKNLAHITSMIGVYLGKTSLVRLTIPTHEERLSRFTKSVSVMSAKALDAMKFEVKVVGYNAEMMASRNFLMIGNHLSYIDVMVAASVQPTVFVTSVDMGQVFFLGTMAELGGSIFVERRNRGQIEKDLGVIVDTLNAGFNVMLYPEGTSSNGQQILPFKKSLFSAAIEAERDILPVCVKYIEIDGEPFKPDNADKVAWYGDMSFAPHFLNLMNLKRVKVEIHFLKPIKVSKTSTRNDLAAAAHKALSDCYLSGVTSHDTPGAM